MLPSLKELKVGDLLKSNYPSSAGLYLVLATDGDQDTQTLLCFNVASKWSLSTMEYDARNFRVIANLKSVLPDVMQKLSEKLDDTESI